jgi:hypothetical protein
MLRIWLKAWDMLGFVVGYNGVYTQLIYIIYETEAITTAFTKIFFPHFCAITTS